METFLTNTRHAELVMKAMMEGNDAEYRRLVFGYLQGDGYAVLASHHDGEISRVMDKELKENQNFLSTDSTHQGRTQGGKPEKAGWIKQQGQVEIGACKSPVVHRIG